jgi:hypothetical protein
MATHARRLDSIYHARSKVLAAAEDLIWPRLEERDAPVIHPHDRRKGRLPPLRAHHARFRALRAAR